MIIERKVCIKIVNVIYFDLLLKKKIYPCKYQLNS